LLLIGLTSADPVVQRVTPHPVDALGRALALCHHTLRYGRAEEIRRSAPVFSWHLVEEVAALGLPKARASLSRTTYEHARNRCRLNSSSVPCSISYA
jgi:hypothetical protein